MTQRDERPIELLLWGATGFTGRLAAEHLAVRYARERIALGGRSESKLEKLRADLAAIDPKCAAWPIRTADALDVAALDGIVPQARVIATTAGPFSRYGHELAAACARHGTDYCDITGEVPFAREVIDRNHARAKESGARIVPFCGFDSIPSDLGVFLLQELVKRERGAPCSEALLLLVRARGGVSGGTAASMLTIMEEAGRDPRVRAMLRNPYALAGPDDHGPASDAHGVKRCGDAWTAPFAMGPVNSRVVHRTNALLDYPYGRDFRYEERVAVGSGARGLMRASAMSAGLAAAERALTLGPIRALAKGRLPAPGEGPSKEKRQSGSFFIRVTERLQRAGAAEDGATCNVSGQGDPGYSGAAKMLVESALCLSRDVQGEGGVLTPASCMGHALATRLRAVGIAFDVQSSPDP
jgi:short subunit dehydrogenase-like uncharacterized protein